MAFIEKHGDYERFNVSHAAGAGAANYWTDIMLVQYLISQIYLLAWDGSTGFDPRLSESEFNDLPDPKKDFKNLKKTERWIRRFQKDAGETGYTLVVDGRVDRARGLTSAMTLYTMQGLNDFGERMFRAKRDVQGEWIPVALNDPAMPPMLRGQLVASVG